MSEWLNKVFSGGVSLNRVNPVGIVILVLAIILLISVRPVSMRCGESKRDRVCNGMRVAALVVCALGAVVSIL